MHGDQAVRAVLWKMEKDKGYNMRSGDPLQGALGEVKEIKIGERNNKHWTGKSSKATHHTPCHYHGVGCGERKNRMSKYSSQRSSQN